MGLCVYARKRLKAYAFANEFVRVDIETQSTDTYTCVSREEDKGSFFLISLLDIYLFWVLKYLPLLVESFHRICYTRKAILLNNQAKYELLLSKISVLLIDSTYSVRVDGMM